MSFHTSSFGVGGGRGGTSSSRTPGASSSASMATRAPSAATQHGVPGESPVPLGTPHLQQSERRQSRRGRSWWCCGCTSDDNLARRVSESSIVSRDANTSGWYRRLLDTHVSDPVTLLKPCASWLVK